jgi:sarcosine oxidase subunit gamma
MADLPLRRSPPLAVPGADWCGCGPLAAFSLRGDLAAAHEALSAAGALTPPSQPALKLSLAACRANVQGDWVAMWLGPDEQLLVGPHTDGPEMAQRIEDALRAVPHALVDVSHRQAVIELRGPFAEALLNTGCPLDLDPEAAPVGFCTRTVFGKAEIVLWRRAEQCFQLQTWRSFLPYVTGLLAVAAEEHAH